MCGPQKMGGFMNPRKVLKTYSSRGKNCWRRCHCCYLVVRLLLYTLHLTVSQIVSDQAQRYMYINILICMCIYIYIYTSVNMYEYVCVLTYVYINKCVHLHLFIIQHTTMSVYTTEALFILTYGVHNVRFVHYETMSVYWTCALQKICIERARSFFLMFLYYHAT